MNNKALRVGKILSGKMDDLIDYCEWEREEIHAVQDELKAYIT